MNPVIHYTAPYLLNPTHPVTINLIGCGGTGSQMLNNLAVIHVSLIALGHPGFHVTAWDPDTITEANLGRQLFAEGDVGLYKSMLLITRINRFYGTRWDSETRKYATDCPANIVITCTDTVRSRREVLKATKSNYGQRADRFPYYWLDLGNTKTFGQAVLGTFGEIKQPAKTFNTTKTLKNIFDYFPNMVDGKDQGPSCSLAEAIEKQDPFINRILAQYGANLIWKLFKEIKMEYHGVFVNLTTLSTNPIKIMK